jgi:hypothetical protein
MVIYANNIMCGLNKVTNLGDGYSINLTWYQAYPSIVGNQIAYHIYYEPHELINYLGIFHAEVKFVIIDGSLSCNIINLTPGQDYFWCVRPVEYDPNVITFLPDLPISHDNVRFYPSSLLSSNMTATQLTVPLIDVEGFPSAGIVKVGIELIQYFAIDYVNSDLIVPGGNNGDGGHLLLQSNNEYYLPNPENVGQGYIANLKLINQSAVDQNWEIKCAFVERDSDGNPIPGTAKFQAIGNIDASEIDDIANYIIWVANGPIVANDTLSFSIVETSTFVAGDSFLVQVVGAIPGLSSGRGFNNTPITMHTVSGWDGYQKNDPIVSMIAITEDTRFDNIYSCQCRFEYPHFPYTVVDGYHQVTEDYLSTNLTAADAVNVSFPMYSYAGWHRTDPVLALNGTCVGLYLGGQLGCIDGYGNYNMVRGLNLENMNTQRQDLLLSVTGQPACLIKRTQTGITCNCYLTESEYPDDRCPFCYGSRFVLGYQQYFNPRSSDGRIQVRLSPTAENLKMYEAGLESEFPLDIWTLTVPTIKTRDILVLFDQDDNESFRYEVSDVTRNIVILGLDGGQHMKTFRIRKTDPAYQIKVFRDTSDFPQIMNTGLGFAPGLPPHSHSYTGNQNDPTTWSQLTQVSQGHNHVIQVVNGILQVMPILGHTHSLPI